MRRRRVATYAVLACVALLVGGGAARADAPDQQGWWTSSNPGGLPANPASASDVPADGLLVQGGPGGPTAYAALSYSLPSGGTPDKLTLKVAPSTVTTPAPTVQLCALKSSSFSPEQGGPMSDAPTYDCNKKVTGTADSGGSTFTFSGVGAVVADGALNAAILPGDSTSRVVFSKPDSSSLQTTPGGSAVSSGVVTTDTGGATAGSGAAVGGSTSVPAAAPPLPSQPVAAAPDAGSAPVVAASPSAAPAGNTLPLNAATVAATSAGGSSTMPRVVGGLAIAGFVVAVLLWAFAGGNRSAQGWQPES